MSHQDKAPECKSCTSCICISDSGAPDWYTSDIVKYTCSTADDKIIIGKHQHDQPFNTPKWCPKNKPAPTPNPSRVCIFCKHWYFNPGTKSYSETPGEEWASGCQEKKWTLDAESCHTELDWSMAIRWAQTCDQYRD